MTRNYNNEPEQNVEVTVIRQSYNKDLVNKDHLPEVYHEKIDYIVKHFAVRFGQHRLSDKGIYLKGISSYRELKPNKLYVDSERNLYVFKRMDTFNIPLFYPIYPCWHKDYMVKERLKGLTEILV